METFLHVWKGEVFIIEHWTYVTKLFLLYITLIDLLAYSFIWFLVDLKSTKSSTCDAFAILM